MLEGRASFLQALVDYRNDRPAATPLLAGNASALKTLHLYCRTASMSNHPRLPKLNVGSNMLQQATRLAMRVAQSSQQASSMMVICLSCSVQTIAIEGLPMLASESTFHVAFLTFGLPSGTRQASQHAKADSLAPRQHARMTRCSA